MPVNNDLISRSALMEDLQEYLNQEVTANMTFTDMGEGIDLSMERVKEAPAVDAEPVRHGRWVIEWDVEIDYHTGEHEDIPDAVCPFCGYREGGCNYDDGYWGRPPNYCPNCGAKMDKAKAGE